MKREIAPDVAFDCAFRCGLLALPGDWAFVTLADGALVAVCADCRAALERGRPPRSAGYLTTGDGSVHRAFALRAPEASA